MDWLSLPQNPFLRPTEVEAFLSTSRATLLRMIDERRFKGAIKVGGQWRLPRASVLTLIEAPADVIATAAAGPVKASLTLLEVATRWAISLPTLTRLVSSGELHAIQLRSTKRILRSEVLRYETRPLEGDDDARDY